MPIVFECPSCGKKLKIPDDLVGQQVRCSDCAGTFVADRPRSTPPPRPSRRESPDDYDGERRRREDRYENLEPHRGGMIMAFGIISVVLVLLSGGVYIGGTAGGGVLGAAGIPVAIIGLVLGILAWNWGGADLKRMAAGYMDPSGRGNTQAGYICGIIGTILNALGLIGACVALVAVLAFGVALAGCCMFSAAASQPPAPIRPAPPRRFELPVAPGLPDYMPRRP